jgi:hypothetical protein
LRPSTSSGVRRLANLAVERTAGSPSLAAAAHRGVRPRYRRALVVLALLALVGCESNTAESRLRKHLQIGPATPLTEPTIRAAALRLLPVGSDESDVREIVTASGIGGDGLSSYYPPGANGVAHIVIRLDSSTFGSVKREYSLALQFTRERKLDDIQVKTWLTGP